MDREDRHRNRRERDRDSPSFSSTLLDAIYRSIDEGHARDGEEELVLYRETMKKKHSNSNFSVRSNGDVGDNQQALDNLRRACLIEKWMEKKVSEKVVVRRKSIADFDRKSRGDRDSLFLKSSSSSSDSSSGGGFSSSEAESVYGGVASKPKSIRTSVSAQTATTEKVSKHEKQRDAFRNHYQQHDNVYLQSQQKPKHEGGFVKTKSRALKIYGDLKKVKQPISPGGKLATFLNSLFNSGNAKKAKMTSSRGGNYDDSRTTLERESKSAHASTCSSASSFSRSCLSKTPSSRGKLSNGMKRSVRFYPVSVIVDEDCQPCGHKSLFEEESNLQAVQFVRNNINNEELKIHLNEKNRRVEEAARDLLKNYQKKVEYEFDLMNNNSNGDHDIDMDDEDDDAASYASSDLFELDNLSAIGNERFRQELPVYGTTRFDSIANGLIM